MKKIILFIAVMYFYNFQSQNLILNPSAELPLVNGEIPNWTETIGNSWQSSPNITFGGAPTPNSGEFVFFAGSNIVSTNGFDTSELEQTIDIASDATAIDTGNKNYFFSGYTRSFTQFPTDQSNIFIQFLDVNNSLISSSAFGPFNTTTTWNTINSSLLAPINARKIKIKLKSIRVNGSDNDGVYDDLYLGSVPLLSIIKNTISKINSTIFPNPSNGIFNIKIENAIENATISVADLNGRIVYETKIKNINYKVLDLNHLQNGVYILNISDGSSKYSQKLIKQ